MQIIRDWHAPPPYALGACLALGNFDGVHLGHAALLAAAHAARPDLALGVLTFEPHPRNWFRPDDPPFRLTPSAERAAALAAHNVRLVVEIPFDQAFADLPAGQFLNDVLGTALAARHLCCGPDFAFGHRRGGDVSSLTAWSEAHGVGLTVVPPVADAQGQISSTRIRRLLQDGYPERAAAALGRPWSLRGIVQHGDARGRTIGFPTANIQLGEHLEPARGVYAVTVRSIDRRLPLKKGVANIGRRPTVSQGTESRIEAHLFDWSGDLYGQELEVSLHAFIRPERRFATLLDLQAQIAQDAADARALLR